MIGSIVFATEQGLGYLAKSFHDHGLLDKVLIHPHSSRTSHPEWFKEQKPFSKENFDWLLKDLKVLLIFETAFHWPIVTEARKRGIKTVLIPMYECTPDVKDFDLILSPSALDKKYFPDSIQITIPTEEPWKLREKALTFVHNSGNGGIGGRNGTQELIEAMKYVKSPIKLIMRAQEKTFTSSDPRITFEGPVSRDKLYSEGDVFIFPEKFNGLSLPIQEACASGMAIMCGARFPMTEWLSNELMIPIKGYKTEMIARNIEVAVYDPKDIAETIDKWYGKDIELFSLRGRKWARENNWNTFINSFITICGL